MERENLVEETVKRIIADKFGLDSQCVKTDSLLRDDLEADNIDIVELVMEFEKELFVSINDVEAEKFLTVGDVIYCIENKNGYHPISYKSGRVNTQHDAEELKIKSLDDYSTEELIQEIKDRGEWIETDEEELDMDNCEEEYNPLASNMCGDEFKRFLCDVLEVGYCTEKEDLINKIKELI